MQVDALIFQLGLKGWWAGGRGNQTNSHELFSCLRSVNPASGVNLPPLIGSLLSNEAAAFPGGTALIGYKAPLTLS